VIPNDGAILSYKLKKKFKDEKEALQLIHLVIGSFNVSVY
jgi:hypothetical protein